LIRVSELDQAAQIFKPVPPVCSRNLSNASLAHKLTVWHKQRHESEGFLRGGERRNTSLRGDPRFAGLMMKMGFLQ